MPVFRWGHSWNAFQDLEREVDRLLQSVNLTFQGLRFGRQYPPVNLYELEEEFLLTAELPGTLAEDLELTIANGVLSLKGKRVDFDEIPDERFRRRERPFGAWQRALTIPDRIREEGLVAKFSNGILQIHLPKAEAIPPRKIPIVGDSESNGVSR